MMPRYILWMCSLSVTWPCAHAQTAVPYVNANDHFGVFQSGSFHELTTKPPLAVYPNADRLGFVTAEGDLDLWSNNGLMNLFHGSATDTSMLKGMVVAGRGPFVWKQGSALYVAQEKGPWLLADHAGGYTVRDSLVAFHDLDDSTLNVYWRGRTFPVADVAKASEALQWKAGSNTLVFYDRGERTLHLVYRGGTQVLCDSADYGHVAPGGDVVAYWDDGDDAFMIFDRGERVNVEPFAPLSFKAGDGVVAWVSAGGAFRCYINRKIMAITPGTPTDYFVQDSTITWVDKGEWRTFHNGLVETIERYVPENWQVSGTMIAYQDLNRELRIFRNGERIVVTHEPGIKRFMLVGDAVVWQSDTGTVNVWWQGTRYEQY